MPTNDTANDNNKYAEKGSDALHPRNITDEKNREKSRRKSNGNNRGQEKDKATGKLFSVKIFRRRGEVLVAVADAEILGQTFRGNGLKIEVSRSFYDGELLDAETMVSRIRIATIANLVGKRCVAVAVKNGLVAKHGVIKIGDAHHAQIVCLID